MTHQRHSSWSAQRVKHLTSASSQAQYGYAGGVGVAIELRCLATPARIAFCSFGCYAGLLLLLRQLLYFLLNFVLALMLMLPHKVTFLRFLCLKIPEAFSAILVLWMRLVQRPKILLLYSRIIRVSAGSREEAIKQGRQMRIRSWRMRDSEK